MANVLPIMAAATAINAGSAVKNGDDPIPTLMAAGLFTLILEFVSDSLDERLASVMAGTFLLGTFLTHAAFFTDIVAYVTTPKDSHA